MGVVIRVSLYLFGRLPFGHRALVRFAHRNLRCSFRPSGLRSLARIANSACYPDCMSRRSKPTIDDDLRDAVDDDERAALVAELRRRGFVDDAEEWSGLV
jgi:D-alanyl-D-alanine dipeptidase